MSVQLRSSPVATRTRTRRPFVLVTGGKGGVGKTTIAANLGVQLAQEGRRPLLVDLDFGLADLGLMLGIQAESDVTDYLDGHRALADCVTLGPAGVRVLPAGSGNPGMAYPDPERCQRVVTLLRDTAVGTQEWTVDLAIGDSAAGIGPDVLDFAAAADRVLLVTTPDPAALTDAYGVVKALDAHARTSRTEVPTPEVFVNLADDARQAREVSGKLRSACERFLARSPRLVGWMPRSRVVTDAVAAQRPFVVGAAGRADQPRSLAARCLRQLAARFSGLGQPRALVEVAPNGVERHVR